MFLCGIVNNLVKNSAPFEFNKSHVEDLGKLCARGV